MAANLGDRRHRTGTIAGVARIQVVGSINLDLVASASHLPHPGETVGGAVFARHPGGKGANQALAARRLGATVELAGTVGEDPFADEALALLIASGVDMSAVRATPDAPTGVALIVVATGGDNQIVVAPGANHLTAPPGLPPLDADAVVTQLEIPHDTVAHVAATASGLVVLNAAPAVPLDRRVLDGVDVLVVNETEHRALEASLDRYDGLVVRTLGERGAEARRSGSVVATAAAPRVEAIDTVGAGDAFVGALTVALVEGSDLPPALAFACAAGAAATTRAGAQPSLPTRAEVEELLAR